MRRATDLSSFWSCFFAVSESSIFQAKIASHTGAGVNFFFALADALENIGGEVIVFEVIQTILDHLTQIKSLGAAGLGGEEVETSVGFGR